MRLTHRIAVSLVAAATVAAPLHAQELDAELRTRLDDWYGETARRTGSGSWSIAIGTMDGRVLWSVAPELALIPASTTKVFTTGFARSRVGGEARRGTRVVGRGHLDPATGTWRGAWALDFDGDPTLERADRSGPTLAGLARRLAARGIRRLEGPLEITSPTGPADARYPAVWASRFEGRLYAPPVGPLTLHENTFSITIRAGRRPGDAPEIVHALPAGIEALVVNEARTTAGSRRRLRLFALPDGGWRLTGTIGAGARPAGFSAVIHRPELALEHAWAEALRRAGVRWDRGRPAARNRRPIGRDARVVLAEVWSAPLDSIAAEVNRRSLNIGAELLLQWAAGDQTSGPALLTEHVRSVVGPKARVDLVDGSGLSELNRMSALTQMLYLARAPQRPGAEGFPLLLPANGTGTLRRLRHGLPGGVVHAKTGTLDTVATLAGYLGRPDGVLVVSLMYNGRRTGNARAAQWELFRLLGADGVSLPAALETRMGGGGTDR